MSQSAPPESNSVFGVLELLVSRLPPTSVFRYLAEHGATVFPDGDFADLYSRRGRPSEPSRVVASVLVLQRLYGLSDREAVEALEYDVRWKYACGLGIHDSSFSHTVLVEMRARLSRSKRPNRIFERMLDIATSAGLVGRRRVVDSTAVYDAVTTMDTVTLVRNGIVLVLKALDLAERSTVSAVLRRTDTYDKPGKPECDDWSQASCREALIHALAEDGFAVISTLEGRALSPASADAVALLGKLLGQDIERDDTGAFRIIRGTAADRIISLVDPDARHGRKTSSGTFNGYKGHIAVDPDSEIITAAEVTPGNATDASVVKQLLKDVLEPAPDSAQPAVEVFADAAYGAAETLEHLDSAGADAYVNVPPAASKPGLFPKTRFVIRTDHATVTCPNGITVRIRTLPDGSRQASFGAHCAQCPLRTECTSSPKGRNIAVHRHEDRLSKARAESANPTRREKYNSTRPKVERKIAHLMRRRHGGRRTAVRRLPRVRANFLMLTAAQNLARLAHLGAAPQPRRAARAA